MIDLQSGSGQRKEQFGLLGKHVHPFIMIQLSPRIRPNQD